MGDCTGTSWDWKTAVTSHISDVTDIRPLQILALRSFSYRARLITHTIFMLPWKTRAVTREVPKVRPRRACHSYLNVAYVWKLIWLPFRIGRWGDLGPTSNQPIRVYLSNNARSRREWSSGYVRRTLGHETSMGRAFFDILESGREGVVLKVLPEVWPKCSLFG